MNRQIFLPGAVFLSFTTIILGTDGARKNPGHTGATPRAHVSTRRPAGDTVPPFMFLALKWPSEDEMGAKLADPNSKSVRHACRSTVRWLKTILRPELLPPESDIHPLPLKSQMQGYDVVRLRYKIGGRIVQVMATSSALFVVVKDTGRKFPRKRLTIDAAKAYAAECIDRFLNDADRIKRISMKHVRRTRGGVMGQPEIGPESINHWWGLTGWWTDGETVVFSVGKAEPGPLLPTLCKHWFSEEEKR